MELAALVEARADVDDADRRAFLPHRGDEHLVIAEPVLNRDDHAVGCEDATGHVGGPGCAVGLHAHDRGVDRRLAVAERRSGAIDAHEFGEVALERALDDVTDGSHPDDRDAELDLDAVSHTAFGRAGFARSCLRASSSFSFIVKLCSASGNAPERTSASNARSAVSTCAPTSA